MVELLQLAQAGLTVTAVALTFAVSAVAIITGTDIPDIIPLMESVEEKTK